MIVVCVFVRVLVCMCVGFCVRVCGNGDLIFTFFCDVCMFMYVHEIGRVCDFELAKLALRTRVGICKHTYTNACVFPCRHARDPVLLFARVHDAPTAAPLACAGGRAGGGKVGGVRAGL